MGVVARLMIQRGAVCPPLSFADRGALALLKKRFSYDHTSPLLLACEQADAELVRLLCQRGGADPNALLSSRKDSTSDSDCTEAAVEGGPGARLSDEDSRSPSKSSGECDSPPVFFVFSICNGGRDDDMKVTGLLRTLVDSGAEVNQTNIKGQSPLWLACSRGLTGAAKFLRERGAVWDLWVGVRGGCGCP
uniref:Uncharacterized protein n=1 Tax=Chromera velia CCMP2878 TaxID=1169474 RepID=A0A0G4GQM1_9ALVE|eukprot:Cvel_719.t1-p1 / transcript=Cvel_719.t1 / gene=Cvel_719 / organism=Chromera_velia_CCMP2878 / gene_product=hypothetical protein / transcript_product=hypothetical protein / location=Cvel_scaffold22:132374-132943(-) / protein_length=190 / sequence_SO=supercontig / SO=protein_coding / is_pseudo=false